MGTMDSTQELMLYQIEEVANAVYESGMRQVDKDKLVKEVNKLRDTYKKLYVKEG